MNFVNTFATGFTVRSLCSVPVILIAILWAIINNLGDAVHNTTQGPVQRVIVVAAAVLIQFGLTWLLAHLIPKHLDARWRAGLLLTLFLFASLLRGFLVAFTISLLGEQSNIVLAPRLFGAVVQSLEIALFALAYGLLIDIATSRQALTETEHRLTSLANEVEVASQAESVKLIEQVRMQLRRSLNWTESTTPADMVHILDQSIDDMVRPLSQKLRIDAVEHKVVKIPAGAAHIDWRSTWASTFAGDSTQFGITWVLLAITVANPAITLFGTLSGLAYSLIISGTMTLGLWCGIRITYLPLRRYRMVFAIVLSSIFGDLALWFTLPRDIVAGYMFITPFAVSLTTLVPAITVNALRQSREILERLETRNAQLAWNIARNSEKTRQRRSTIAAALHGTVQAALAASSLRLQIAIRDGADIELAAAQARDAATKAIAFEVLDQDSRRTLLERIDELRDSWADLIEVRTDIPFLTIDSDPICSRLIAELAAEGVLNAVKHAQASWVRIECSEPHDRIVTLTVSNPVEAESTAGPDGGGTKLLEGAALRWDRTVTDRIVTVTAELPWESQH